jgi:hypothetical protein
MLGDFFFPCFGNYDASVVLLGYVLLQLGSPFKLIGGECPQKKI